MQKKKVSASQQNQTTGALESGDQNSVKSDSEIPSTTNKEGMTGGKYDLSKLYSPQDKSIQGTPEQARVETQAKMDQQFKPESIKKVDEKLLKLNDNIVSVSRDWNDSKKILQDNLSHKTLLEDKWNDPNVSNEEKIQIQSIYPKVVEDTKNSESLVNQNREKAVELQKAKSTLNKVYDVQEKLNMDVNDDALKASGNFLSHVYNAVPETVSGAGALTESVGSVFFKENPLYQIVGDAIKGMGDNLKAETNEKYDDKHYISSTIGDIVGSIAVSAIPGGMAAKARKAAQMITGATTATMQMADGIHEKAKAVGLSDKDAGVMTLAIAPVAGLLEVWGATNIIDNISGKKALNELMDYSVKNLAGKTVTKELVYNTVSDGFKEIGKKYGISALKSAGEEGLTEGVQGELEAGAENLYDIAKGEEKYGTKLFSSETQLGVAKQAALGAVAGTAFGVISGINTKESLYKQAIELDSNPEKQAKFLDMINTEVKAGHITEEQANNITNTISSIVEMDKTIPPIVADENKRIEAIGLISERDNITKENQKIQSEMVGLDYTMVGPQQELIAKNNERINAINSDLTLIAKGSGKVDMDRKDFSPSIVNESNKRTEEANKRTEEANKRTEEANKRTEEANLNSSEAIKPILSKMNNAEYINEHELNSASDHLYDLLDQNEKSDKTPEQKQSYDNLISPLINKIEGYEFRTKTKTSTVTEGKTTLVPRENKTVAKVPALEQSEGSEVTITKPNGDVVSGIISNMGGSYTVNVRSGEQIVIGEKSLIDRDLKLPSDDKMENPITFDNDGNVETITFEAGNGNLITIKGHDKALDLAIQLRADVVGEVPQPLFDQVYEEFQRPVTSEELVNQESNNSNVNAPTKTVPVNETVKETNSTGTEPIIISSTTVPPINVSTPSTTASPAIEDSQPVTNVSGIKKSLVSDDVVRPDWEKISDKDLLEMGKELVGSGEVNPGRIVSDVISGEKVVLEPKEVSALIYHKATLDKSLKDKYSEKNEAIESGKSINAINDEISNLESDIFNYNVMSLITAQQQSLAFRLRRGLRDSNSFDVVKEIYEYKSKNEGKIPKEVEEKFKAIAKELEDLKQQINDLEFKEEGIKDQANLDNISEDIERGNKRDKNHYKKTAKASADNFRKKYKSKANTFIIKDENGNDVEVDVTVNGVGKDAIVELIAQAIEATGSIADAITNISVTLKEKEWFNKLSKENQDNLNKQIVDSLREEEGLLVTMKDGKLNIPSKLIRDYVSSGKKEINELTDILHADIVKEFPDVTKREVRDAITGYGKTVNKTKTELETDINKLKRLGKLLSQKEDLEAGKVPIEVKSKIVKKSDFEIDLKKEIKSLEDGLGITEKMKTKTATTRVKTMIAKREEMLRTGNYPAKVERKLNLEDTPLNKLKAKSEKLREEIREDQYRNELKNRTFPQAVKADSLKIVGGLLRGLVAGFDLGAAGVQGGMRLFSHPIEAFNAFKKSLVAFGSTKKSEEFLNNIKSQEWFPMMKSSGVELLEDSYRTKIQEEQPLGNIIGMIWNLPPNLIQKAFGKNAVSDVWKNVDPYKAAQRAYVTHVNYLRVQSFLKLADKLESDGIDLKTDKKRLKALGDYINTQTGRASLGKYESTNEVGGALFFSLRRQVAALKMISPYAAWYHGTMPSYVRKHAIIESIKSLTTVATVAVLAQAAFGEDDDWDEFFDSNSSNFMSVKIKGEDGSFTTISLLGAMKSMVNAVSRIKSGKFTDSATGKKSILGERYGKPINTKWDVFTNYVENKFSPGIGDLKKILNQTAGNKIDYSEMAGESATPMWVSDVASLHQDHPELIGELLTALNILGLGVTHYESNKDKKAKSLKRQQEKRREKNVKLLGR